MVWNYLGTLLNALWIAFVLRQDIPKALDKMSIDIIYNGTNTQLNQYFGI